MFAEPENPSEEILRIITAFALFEGSYKREEVEAAIERKDEIAPFLLRTLERVLEYPEEYFDEPDFFGHYYALNLLGYFRYPAAHNVMLDLAGLPEEVLHEVFGDSITEDFSHVLADTCNGDVTGIIALLRNRRAGLYARAAAADALCYTVADGIVPRGEVLAVLTEIFSSWSNEDDGDEDLQELPGLISYCLLDLDPVASLPLIVEAWEAGVIPDFFMTEKDLAHFSTMGEDDGLTELAEKRMRRYQHGVHGVMQWWACFNTPAVPGERSFDAATRVSRLPNKKKSAKRKHEKSSRRKNRRKK
jgi:hypothetical protein